jgi:hypothetical protein
MKKLTRAAEMKLLTDEWDFQVARLVMVDPKLHDKCSRIARSVATEYVVYKSLEDALIVLGLPIGRDNHANLARALRKKP